VIVKPDFHGIFMHNRHEFDDVNEGYFVVNNTIIAPEDSGTYYNTVITRTNDPSKLYGTQENVPTYFINNLVVDPGNDHATGNTWKGDQESYFDFNKKIERDSSAGRIYSNLMTRQMDTLGLSDISNNDFSPSSVSSDLVDNGSDISSWGIDFDFNHSLRPQGNGFEIGAYELLVTTLLRAGPFHKIEVLDTDKEESLNAFAYPNPATSSFTLGNVSERSVKLQLVSFDGRILFEKIHVVGTPILTEEYASGLYFLKITSGSKTVVRRLVIK